MGSPLDKLLIIAVLTSAAASTQTTILPTTRTSLSMAAKGAAPSYFARVHPRYLTPSTSTIWFGVISIVWYVGLTYLSSNVLGDSIIALGLMICFYYGITGFACVVFYRRELTKSARNLHPHRRCTDDRRSGADVGLLPVVEGPTSIPPTRPTARPGSAWARPSCSASVPC